MPPKAELTPQFLKLQNKMRETREGEWIFISKKIKDKYSNLIIDQITRTRKDEDFSEYRAIAQDLSLNIKTYINYVSMSIGDTEYEVDSYIDVIGALNTDEKHISIEEIVYYMNWDFSIENYLDFE
tara:strand:- start:489 stop:866 length:378 start_codon:yes stop_codon:yes gene_type:complete